MRRELAGEQGVPAYVVLHDRTLLELARVRPTDHFMLEEIPRHGPRRKCAAYGDRILEEIRLYCRQHGLRTDLPTERQRGQHGQR